MSNLKRFLALTIAVVMIVSGMALNVSAARPSDVTDPDLIYAIDTLNKLGVIKGTAANEDGTFVFSGEDFVTREQFALFTARISTALPSLFEVDQGLEIEKPFTDLKDPTFYSAINHLNSEGIVLGVGDDKFDPSSNVTLQDAVTMLIRSLNYTGLIYPTGFMVKANDKMVALIGEDADFPLSDVLPNQPITRNDMAKLLWNYLMTKKQELTMIYNPGKGEWEPRDTGKMVLTLFGFNAQQGYITGVSGWSANINVPDGSGYRTLSGPALNPNQNTQTASNKNDIVVTTYTQDYYYADINNTNQVFGVVPGSVKEIRTTKAGLNLTDEKYTDEYLLGLKIQVFEDKRYNPVVQINIPAKIIGEKFDVTDAGNDSKFENQDGDINKRITKVNSLTLGVSDDKTLTYIQDATVRDILPWTNLYMFNRDSATMRSSNNFRQYLTDIRNEYNAATTTWSRTTTGDVRIDEGDWSYGNADAIGGTKEYLGNIVRDGAANDAIKTFARYIKADNKTHYALEYVDNGMFQDGNGYWVNDFYYVFRPLEVAYYTKTQDGAMVFSKNLSGDEDKNNHALTNNWLGTWGVSFKGKALADGLTVADDVKPGEAFLYAVYGDKLHIYEKLGKVATDRSTFANNNTVRFTDKAKFPDIVFNNTTKWKANGAFGGVVGRGITTNKLFNLFADSSGTTLFARDITPDERATFENSHYVVVANRYGIPNSTNIAEGGAIYSGYMYDVLDTVDNTYKYVQIVNIDGGAAVNNLQTGTPLRLIDSKVGGAVYLNAYTNAMTDKIANTTKGAKDNVYEYYFTQLDANLNLDNLNAAETAILVANGNAFPRSNTDRTRAELRNDTKVYVYNSTTPADPIRATNITGLRGVLRSAAVRANLTVVGKGATYPGTASFIFMTSDMTPSGISSGAYGAIVTNVDSARFIIEDKTYYQYTARIAVNGKLDFMEVVVQDGANKDDFIKLSGKTVSGYAEAVIISSAYNVNGMPNLIASFGADNTKIFRTAITNAVNSNVPDSDGVEMYFGKVLMVPASDEVRYGETRVILGDNTDLVFTFGSDEVRYSRFDGGYQTQWIGWNGASAEGDGSIFWDQSYRQINPDNDNKKLFHDAYVAIYAVKGEVVFINVVEDFR